MAWKLRVSGAWRLPHFPGLGPYRVWGLLGGSWVVISGACRWGNYSYSSYYGIYNSTYGTI